MAGCGQLASWFWTFWPRSSTWWDPNSWGHRTSRASCSSCGICCLSWEKQVGHFLIGANVSVSGIDMLMHFSVAQVGVPHIAKEWQSIFYLAHLYRCAGPKDWQCNNPRGLIKLRCVEKSWLISIPSCNPTWTSNNGQERIASIKGNDRATQNFGRK